MIFENLILRSFLTGIFISIAYALLGIILVNKRMSFFADGIAHAILAGLALGVLFNFSPIIISIITAILFSFLIRSIQQKTKLHTDALIGIIFTFGFSLGLVLLLLLPKYRGSLLDYLLGDILTISILDFLLTLLALLIISFLFFHYRKYIILWLVDEDYFNLEVRKSQLFEIIFYIILGIMIVFGIKIGGVVLVSALMIIPPSTARLISSSFKNYVLLSIFLSLIGFLIGFAISYYGNLPTGPTIVLAHSLLFFFAFLIFTVLSYNIKK
jgi:zinc transport system permease protein